MNTFKKSLIVGFGKGYFYGGIAASIICLLALVTTLCHYPNPGQCFFAFLVFCTWLNTTVLGIIFTAKEMGNRQVKRNTGDFVPEEEI